MASRSNHRRRDQSGVGAMPSHGDRPALAGSTLIADRSRHRRRGTSHRISPAETSASTVTPRSRSSSSMRSLGATMSALRAHASNEPAAVVPAVAGATSAAAGDK
eukprot:scaffold16686_cov97-Isochrysis_galbana.AAC.2